MSAAFPFLGLMEAVKLYLLASYAFLPLDGRMPLLPAACALLGALALSRALRAAGGRRIYHLLAYALGLSASVLWAINAYRGSPIFSLRIFPATGRELVAFLLVSGWAAAFYFRGLWLGSCGKGPRFCVARFDEGIAAFLFCLALAAVTRVENDAAGRLALPYFLFSSVALAICRADGSRRGGLSRRSRSLLAVPVAAAALVGSAGVAALSPLMYAPAAGLGRTLKGAITALEPHLVRFLRWLFGFYALPVSGGAAGPDSNGGAPEIASVDHERVSAVVKVILWALGALAVAAAAAAVIFGLRWLIPRLFAKVDRRGGGLKLGRLRAWIRSLLSSMRRRRTRSGRRSAAIAAYTRLLACGRHAAAPRKRSETPREYARRLAASFPGSASGALKIVDALEREAYGLQAIGPETERTLASIRRRLSAASFIAEKASMGIRGAARAIGLELSVKARRLLRRVRSKA